MRLTKSWRSGARPAASAGYNRGDAAFHVDVRQQILRPVAEGGGRRAVFPGKHPCTAHWRVVMHPRPSFHATCFAATSGPIKRCAGPRRSQAAPPHAAWTCASEAILAGIFSTCRSCIRSSCPTSSAASNCFVQAGDTDNLGYAQDHADIIRRFGRFPHRNRVLDGSRRRRNRRFSTRVDFPAGDSERTDPLPFPRHLIFPPNIVPAACPV